MESEYKAVSQKVIEWLIKKFEDAGYAVLNKPSENHLQYMQLAPKEKQNEWSQINFHFEILWQSDFMTDSEFTIDVHLENHKGIAQDLQNHFELKNDKERGDKMPLQSTILTGCSFETEQRAETTFERIMEVLKSGSFQKWADKANTWKAKD